MRSLWRILALQWLRGDGSEALRPFSRAYRMAGTFDVGIAGLIGFNSNYRAILSCATKMVSRPRPGG